MEDKGRKQGWLRKRKEREQIRSGGAHSREEDELCGGGCKWQGKEPCLCPPPPVIYKIERSNAPKNSAHSDN
jgi:hypothetical protein